MSVTWVDETYTGDAEPPLLARVYVPAQDPLGALVLLHGGTWTSGDRLSNAATAFDLAEAGFLVASIDVRKPPEASYPGPVADLNLAVRWLKGQAAAVGLGAEKVGAIGFSSGGHQVMLNALRPHDPRYAGGPAEGEGADGSVAYAVLCYAVLDPLVRYEMARRSELTMLVERSESYFGSVDAMAEGNPQRLVEDHDVQLTLPPICAIQGLEDGNLPVDMAANFVAAYQARGGVAELHEYAGTPHGFLSKSPGSATSVEATDVIVAFARRMVGR